MKKTHLSVRVTLLIIVGVLNTLIALLVGNGVYKSWVNYQHAQTLKVGSDIINALYNTNKNLSLARASSLSRMYAAPDVAEALQNDVLKNRNDADVAWHFAVTGLEKENAKEISSGIVQLKNKYQILQKQRIKLDAELEIPIAQRDREIANSFFAANTELIIEIQNFILIYSRSYQNIDTTISRQMMFKYFVWELAEYSGEEYAIIGQMIAENKHPTSTQQEQLISLRDHIQYGWEILHKFSVNEALAEKLLPFMEEAKTQYFFTFEQINELFYGIHSPEVEASYPISTEMWLGISAQAVDSLLVLQDEILKATQQHVELIEAKAKKEIVVSAFIVLCALMLSLYCWSIIVFRVTRPVNAMIDALYKATHDNVFEMPKIDYNNDEIGKLARVLEVFQKNAQKMKRSNEELERFAFLAAHDLKSPLRAVDNISQWLEEDLEGLLPETSKKHLEELHKRIHLMDKLLDDTLDYARMDAKMESKDNEICSGKALMAEIITLIEPPAGFTIKIGHRLSQISLQKFPVQQVLYNLVNNAVKHHNQEKGIINVDVEEDETEYIFYVSDDGPGIEPQYHHKIFEMFQTLQPQDKSKGRGMGLAMARKIVAANGGDITVESKQGQGAIFRFTWPKPMSKIIGEYNANVRRRYA